MTEKRRGQIHIFPGSGERPAPAMLQAAVEAGLKDVMIIGWKDDGDLFMSASCTKVKDMQWLLWNADSELREYMSQETE